MAPTSLGPFLRHLRKILDPSRGASVGDAELLERFVQRRDEAAFELLVWRHQRLVWSVCRRVLVNVHDAEDAFQATFLALARKADSLRRHRFLAGWLHTVAYHIALRARKNVAKRATVELDPASQASVPDPADEAVRRDLAAVLDEEVNRLPEKYRLPIVLCYLEGKTYLEASRQLGVPLGTLSARLTKARDILRTHLLRRGIGTSGALLAAVLGEQASMATASAALVNTTVQTAGAGTISATVAALMEGALRSMFIAKLKIGVLVLLAGLVIAGSGLLIPAALVPTTSVSEAPHPATPPGEGRAESVRTDLYGDPLPPGALMRLGTTRLRHLGLRIAFSTDGKRLLSFSSRDRTLRQWDAVSGRELRRISLQGAEYLKPPSASAWAGKSVAMWNKEHLVLWDASSGRERRRIETAINPIQNFALSPSGDTLAAVIHTDKGDTIRLWDAVSGEERHSLDHPQSVYELTFSADGKLLGTVIDNQDLHLWEVSTGKRLRTIPGAGRQIAFSPDGSKVASVALVNREGVVKVWNVADGREIAVLPKVEGAGYFSVRFSPDSKLLATGGTHDMLLFNIADRKLLRRMPTWGWVAFAPDGKTLASAGVSAIHLWDTATGREISPRPCQDGSVGFLAVTADGRRVASLSPYDPTVHLWDVATGKSLTALRAGGHFRDLHTGALSSDGKRFASGGSDGKVRVWDLDKAQEVRQMSVDLRNAQGQLNPEIIALSFASGTARLAVVSMAWHTLSGSRPKYQLDLWDVDTGKSIVRRALPMESWPVCFTGDGRTVVFRAKDRLVIQNVATGREGASLTGDLREPFVLSPDGQILAAMVCTPKTLIPGGGPPADPGPADSRTIVLTELATGKSLHRIETGKSGLNHLAYSPNGRTLAATVADGFRLWDVATGKEVFHRALPETSGLLGYPFASSLAFLPDGGRLATGLQDGTILIWDLEPKTWHAGGKPKDLDRRDLERMWAELASDDAIKAHRAVWSLATAPEKAVPFLKEHLRPVPALDNTQVQQWIADLDSEQFPVREAAGKKLASFGERAKPALRQALEGKPSLEARKRLQALYADAEAAGGGLVRSAEVLRTLRAIRVLEYISTVEARQVLQELAAGAPEARPTTAAQAALKRLGQ